MALAKTITAEGNVSKRLLAILTAAGPSGILPCNTRLKELLHCSRDTVSGALAALLAAGKIKRYGRPHSSQWELMETGFILTPDRTVSRNSKKTGSPLSSPVPVDFTTGAEKEIQRLKAKAIVYEDDPRAAAWEPRLRF